MIDQQEKKSSNDIEKPPLLSSWPKLYLVVFLNLVLLVVLFYIFTKYFS
ncbi:MAG TPA: hypothetical protein PLP19_14215 [bacterium]|nr:hypothetical protein [bacterium]HPN44644.1 hypothetical protein [bacterium]